MNTTPQTPKNKIKPIIAAVIAFFVSFFVAQYFFSKSNYDKELANVAKEINKTCPMIVDESTRLDSVSAHTGKILQYNYTLVDLYKVDVNLDTVKKYVFPKVLEKIKNSPEMGKMRENETIFNYNYIDKTGKFVFKYTVTPEMYQ